MTGCFLNQYTPVDVNLPSHVGNLDVCVCVWDRHDDWPERLAELAPRTALRKTSCFSSEDVMFSLP